MAGEGEGQVAPGPWSCCTGPCGVSALGAGSIWVWELELGRVRENLTRCADGWLQGKDPGSLIVLQRESWSPALLGAASSPGRTGEGQVQSWASAKQNGSTRWEIEADTQMDRLPCRKA